MQHTSSNLSRSGSHLMSFTILSLILGIQVCIFVLFALFMLTAVFPIDQAIIVQSTSSTIPAFRNALEGILLLTGIVSLTLAWRGNKHME